MQVICSQCHHLGQPAKKKRGSRQVEFMLLMVFPFGVPYTIWRMFGKIKVCKACGSQMLIPAESTVGRRLLAKSLDAMGGVDTEHSAAHHAPWAHIPSPSPQDPPPLSPVPMVEPAAAHPHEATFQRDRPPHDAW
jgi:hypothetical protein